MDGARALAHARATSMRAARAVDGAPSTGGGGPSTCAGAATNPEDGASPSMWTDGPSRRSPEDGARHPQHLEPGRLDGARVLGSAALRGSVTCCTERERDNGLETGERGRSRKWTNVHVRESGRIFVRNWMGSRFARIGSRPDSPRLDPDSPESKWRGLTGADDFWSRNLEQLLQQLAKMHGKGSGAPRFLTKKVYRCGKNVEVTASASRILPPCQGAPHHNNDDNCKKLAQPR